MLFSGDFFLHFSKVRKCLYMQSTSVHGYVILLISLSNCTSVSMATTTMVSPWLLWLFCFASSVCSYRITHFSIKCFPLLQCFYMSLQVSLFKEKPITLTYSVTRMLYISPPPLFLWFNKSRSRNEEHLHLIFYLNTIWRSFYALCLCA